MTANELVEYIAEDLNTPSQESKTRIGHELNVRYKQVTSSIGLIPSRRVETSAVFNPDGDASVPFENIEKLDVVYRYSGVTYPDAPDPEQKPILIKEITYDELLTKTVRTDYPTYYCVMSVGPARVTVKFDCVASDFQHVYATGLSYSTTLTNNDQPAFPESFHDILIHGVKADEYRRKEKMPLARECEMLFIQRLSDLRMFLAKSAYLDNYRGKHTPAMGWWDYEGRRY
jgi:hypothetical protein